MRQNLDIYASLTLCKSMDGFPTRHSNVDFAIIRENTEGEYSGLEHQAVPGVVESLKIMTKTKSERIARFAFDFALKNGRKKVTCVHKVSSSFLLLRNCLSLSLFLSLVLFLEISRCQFCENDCLDDANEMCFFSSFS